MKTAGIILVVGVLGIGVYLVINSTSKTTNECAGDWTDNFNPACWIAATSNTVTSEINTALLIVGAVVVLVIALLAFGPSTGHIAGAAGKFALL